MTYDAGYPCCPLPELYRKEVAALEALVQRYREALECKHLRTGVDRNRNWCVDCGAIRQAIGTEWEAWVIPTLLRVPLAQPEGERNA